VLGEKNPLNSKVQNIYDTLITSFGNEYSILLDAHREQLMKATTPMIAEGIIRVREKRFKVTPGYDGVYGELRIFENEKQLFKESKKTGKKQRSLEEFM